MSATQVRCLLWSNHQALCCCTYKGRVTLKFKIGLALPCSPSLQQAATLGLTFAFYELLIALQLSSFVFKVSADPRLIAVSAKPSSVLRRQQTISSGFLY